MISRTATDAEVTAWWNKLIAEPDIARASLPVVFPRLSMADQQAACLWLVARFGLATSADILPLMGTAVPAEVSAALTVDHSALVELIRLSRDITPEKAASARTDAHRLANVLSILGLLLTGSDADFVVQTVPGAGVHPADPMLDRLAFNAALKGS